MDRVFHNREWPNLTIHRMISKVLDSGIVCGQATDAPGYYIAEGNPFIWLSKEYTPCPVCFSPLEILGATEL